MKTTFSEFLPTTLKCTILFFIPLLNGLVRIWKSWPQLWRCKSKPSFLESKKLEVQVAACTFNRRHNWKSIWWSKYIDPTKIPHQKSMYQQTWPKKVVESTSVNLSGLKTVIQTYSVALVWINQRPKKNLLNFFSNHTPMLGQKTHSGPIQMPSSVSFPWSNRDFLITLKTSIPNNLTASNYENILTLGLWSMRGIAHTFGSPGVKAT
jgi:hypothetical protein